MIGFGSPADTVRVSEAIALMRSPWLASKPVIRDNAKQLVEFPDPVRILMMPGLNPYERDGYCCRECDHALVRRSMMTLGPTKHHEPERRGTDPHEYRVEHGVFLCHLTLRSPRDNERRWAATGPLEG